MALAELALANGRLARAGVEWGITLSVLRRHPDARRAVLAALWPAEEAERAGQPGQAAADAGTARLGGDDPAGQPAGVPLPAGKREPELEGQARRTVYDGVAHRPILPSWGGRIEPGTPRPRGVGGIGDPYGDGGPLDSRD